MKGMGRSRSPIVLEQMRDGAGLSWAGWPHREVDIKEVLVVSHGSLDFSGEARLFLIISDGGSFLSLLGCLDRHLKYSMATK